MNATAPNDEGQYRCTLGSTDDRNPRESIEFNLKLFKTTNFKDTTRHPVLPTGQQGILTCKVEFDPSVSTASVSWIRDQKPIEMLNDSSYNFVDYDPSTQTSQLIISPVSQQHDGVYTCRAVAVTSQLSKISDLDIQLETSYAPIFDEPSQTIWVERLSSASQHQLPANTYAGGRPSAHHQRTRFGKPHYSGLPRKPIETSESSPQPEDTSGDAGNSNSTQTTRVELRCTSKANPPASISWKSTQSFNVLSKGIYSKILGEPRVETDGTNTTSVLVIGFRSSPDWPQMSDNFICTASNKLGKASKTFSIEQGDLPPAFNVGPVKQYNAQTSLFKFTLLGPNFDPETSAGMFSGNNQQHEIVPPVDSFRIRSENSLVADQSKPAYWANSRRHNEPSVQWNLNGQQHNPSARAQVEHSSSPSILLGIPQNFTVNLGRLPSGNQKLFLEAHNAVGWSPNATYLGDYYIISGASSIGVHSNLLLYLLIGSMIIIRLSIAQV